MDQLINPQRQQLEISDKLCFEKSDGHLNEKKISQSRLYSVDQNIILCGYFRNIKCTLNIELPQELQYLIGIFMSRLLVYGIGHAIIASETSYKPIIELNEIVSVVKHLFINWKNIIVTDGDNNVFVVGSNQHLNLHLDSHLYSQLELQQLYLGDKIKGVPCLFSHGICNEYWNFLYCQDNNTLYASGNNEEGCCGNGENRSCNVFLVNVNTIFLKSNDYIIDMICGAAHTLFVTKYGNLYGCGWNGFGCCGVDKSTNNILIPTFIMGDIIKAACGETHNLVVTNKNELIVFGGNIATQLGIGKLTDHNKCIGKPLMHSWFKYKDIKIVNVKCGFHHSLCVDTTGKIYTFGVNNWACVRPDNYAEIDGITAEDEDFDEKIMGFEPYLVELQSKAIDASCGQCHNMILDDNNDIFVWGRNDQHQISSKDVEIVTKPLKISKTEELGINEKIFIEKIICGHSSSIIIINPNKYC